jgi:ABC-2 type transport system ATP-binding protein
MRILATLLVPTSGSASVLGHDVVRERSPIRRTLGYLPQDFGAYPKLTGSEYLEYIAHLKGLKDPRRLAAEMLASMDLTDVAKRRVTSYSGGMLRRIGIAQSLLGDPQILLIDEPTSGLDPEQRAAFRELLLQLSASRTTLLSTHLVEDIALVSRDLAVLNEGRLIFRGAPGYLRTRFEERITQVVLEESTVAEFATTHKERILSTSRSSDGDRVVRLFDAPDRGQPVQPTLEDAYIALLRS